MAKKKTSNAKRSKVHNSGSAVTTVNTAPVSIGNSIRGLQPIVQNSTNGLRVAGRDFVFSVAATPATVTGWTLVGGLPITPSVMPSSALRSYVQMYSKFKINKLAFHYITAAPTTQAGDVVFYYERDRNGAMVDCTSNSFLPFLLSDPNTIFGPQWTNHTMFLNPTDSFNSTDYGMVDDLNEDSCGSLFLFSKTASASSPGYVLMDYDITFKELCVNPRAGILPVARGQWSFTSLSITSTAVTTNSTTVAAPFGGTCITNTTGAAPSGAAAGDIYKIVFDVTNSLILNTWTNVNATNLLKFRSPSGTGTAYTVDDGFTCYGTYNGTNLFLYSTLENAITDTAGLYYGVTATVTYGLCIAVSLVRSNSSFTQATY